MGITKTEGFSEKINTLAEIFKVLGHPARLSILEFLLKQKSCICNDIVNEIPLAQPTISRHLAEMKRVGIIKGSIDGKNINYCLNPDIIQEVGIYFNKLVINVPKNDCC